MLNSSRLQILSFVALFFLWFAGCDEPAADGDDSPDQPAPTEQADEDDSPEPEPSADTSSALSDLSDADARALCEELREIGDCSHSPDEHTEMTVEAPDDCDEFMELFPRVQQADECQATVSDFIDCQTDCATNEEQCNRVTACMMAALQQ